MSSTCDKGYVANSLGPVANSLGYLRSKQAAVAAGLHTKSTDSLSICVCVLSIKRVRAYGDPFADTVALLLDKAGSKDTSFLCEQGLSDKKG